MEVRVAHTATELDGEPAHATDDVADESPRRRTAGGNADVHAHGVAVQSGVQDGEAEQPQPTDDQRAEVGKRASGCTCRGRTARRRLLSVTGLRKNSPLAALRRSLVLAISVSPEKVESCV